MFDNVCFSGGAVGGDQLFGECASRLNHKVIHLHFEKKYRNRPNFKILSETELNAAERFLKKANKTLGRRVPPFDHDNYKLLARNYYQIRDTSRVYAVGKFINGKINGGTAWAVQMFIDTNMDPEIYFFDQMGRGWLTYDKDQDIWSPVNPPEPHGYYTGIGSRDLLENGREAIKGLFTF